jgi:hypothetical protein
MTHEAIKEAAQRHPFRPFAITTSDGNTVVITEQKEIAIHPHTDKTVCVFGSDGSYQILDVWLIISLQIK